MENKKDIKEAFEKWYKEVPFKELTPKTSAAFAFMAGIKFAERKFQLSLYLPYRGD
ncbi:MAG: hypothetical protein AAB696_01940 [Patescibacteria group bacterium]